MLSGPEPVAVEVHPWAVLPVKGQKDRVRPSFLCLINVQLTEPWQTGDHLVSITGPKQSTQNYFCHQRRIPYFHCPILVTDSCDGYLAGILATKSIIYKNFQMVALLATW